mgnify:CR=1 FL=1
MLEVTVKRGAGTRPAQRIVDGLLTGSRAALLARAEAELAASSPDARTADIEIWPDPSIQKGQIVTVLESGESPRIALVRAIKMEESRSDVHGPLARRMTLTVEYRL